MTKKSAKRLAKSKKKIELVTEMPGLKLDLACGQSPVSGFEGVDLYAPNAKHKVDLFKLPLPWADSSVDEINCTHFLEHLPAREVEERDISEPITRGHRIVGKDFLFAFMDECWRVLKPGGKMRVVVPSATSTRAFQDPTHRRFLCAATFFYFAREWRVAQRLDHYRVDCDFGFSAVPIVPSEETLFSAEVQQKRFNECWNVVQDWQVDLIAKKP